MSQFSHPWAALLLALASAGLHGSALALQPGQALPVASLPGSGTAAMPLHDGKAKLTYIDFWASWCGPCRKSMPWMNQMQQKFGPQGLRIVAINLDAQRADAERFLKQVPATVPLAFDPSGDSARRFAVKAMPTSLLVGADGKVIEVHQGFREEDPARLEARFAALLAQP
ncbi:TlpA family protein disulfide reductase [Ideonella sp.]|uniref:TlpA family protein disulfide reductase n=1 Tax=Ideonella sp. TaxID=1929293 RepID=UPI003BB5AB3A